jgi:hypothetical protein
MKKYSVNKSLSFDNNGDYVGRDLNQEEKNKVSTYNKISLYLEKIFTDHHELYHFRVDIVESLQNIIREHLTDLISIKKNHDESKYPIFLHNFHD